MTITHNLTMDLKQKGVVQRIEAVQGDSLTREVAMTLLSGGEAWEIPACDIAVRYVLPDGTAGVYDIISDSRLDYAACGNVLIMTLSPQLFDLAGVVQVQVEFHDQDLRLGVFPFLIVVDPAVGQGEV